MHVGTHNAAPASGEFAARNKLVIGLLLVSTFVVILNETIMSVALPHLMEDLKQPASAVQWLTTAFLLTMAVVIPITGFLLQRIHTRPIFVLAMSFFTIGTVLAGLSPGLPMLIIARIIQATGTAIMFPLLMTTVMSLVPPEARGKTMGNISIVISVAPAIGPTIGGLILNVLSWRWMFWLVVPIALLSLLIGWRRLVNVSEPRYAPLDILSVLLSAIGFGAFVYGLNSVGEAAAGGKTLVPGWIPISIGVVAIALFVLRQVSLSRHEKALLDLRTFRIPTFTVAVVMMAIEMMAMFGAIILLPIYFQNVMGLNTLVTGLLVLPGGLVMGLLAPTVGKLYDQYGPSPLVIPGAILVSVVLWSLTLVDQFTPLPVLVAAHVGLSVGLALLFTPLFTSSLSSLPPNLYPHGSAILGTTQQVAGAAGVALLVALLSVQTAALLHGGVDPVTATASGVRSAFQCAAVVSLLAVLAAFFVKRPAQSAMPADAVQAH